MAENRQSERLKVFISYSRRDLEFVDALQVALLARGINAAVDRTEIAKGEAWWTRIKQLITEADTIVFVLSEGSVNSSVCLEEVEFAEGLKKRFVPIVAQDVTAVDVPPALARLNYIFFIPHLASGGSGDFDTAIDRLCSALEINIDWIREHTRLGVLAQRWVVSQKGNDLLLSGAELKSAESWLSTRPFKAPDPSDTHRAFILRSRQAASKRQRLWLVGVTVIALISAVLAGYAYTQSVEAQSQAQAAAEQRDEAGRQAAIADGQRTIAENRRRETVQLRKQTQFTEAGLLSNAAGLLMNDASGGDAVSAADLPCFLGPHLT